MKNKLPTVAAALVLIAAFGGFSALPLHAQARAALIQNVDEHGRIPYQATGTSNTCNGLLQCDVFFPAVPNNKRLVITHFDAFVSVNNTGSLIALSLSTATSNAKAYPEFMTGAQVGGAGGVSTFISSRAVLFYADAGAAPVVHFNATATVFPVSLTLTGYLLDCTNGCAAMAP